jgi:hypothetical protein
VTEFDVSLEKQEVLVKTSTLDYDAVREKIAKTGKEVGYHYSFPRISLLIGVHRSAQA